MRTLASTDLAAVVGGKLSNAQLGRSAVKFAEKKLHTSPVFLGDVTNSVHQKTFTRQGVMVSTGDEADPQFGVWRVLRKGSKFTGLKDL